VSTWHLECSACDARQPGDSLASVCPKCGQPWLVRYDSPWPARDAIGTRWDMWRYSAVMPVRDEEKPVSLGEGATPILDLPLLARELGVAQLWVKDEGLNPTASFKARGMSAAVTRAAALGVAGLVVPTAGNAGAALSAYGAAALDPEAKAAGSALTYPSVTIDITYTFTPFFLGGNVLGLPLTILPTTIHRRTVMRVL